MYNAQRKSLFYCSYYYHDIYLTQSLEGKELTWWRLNVECYGFRYTTNYNGSYKHNFSVFSSFIFTHYLCVLKAICYCYLHSPYGNSFCWHWLKGYMHTRSHHREEDHTGSVSKISLLMLSESFACINDSNAWKGNTQLDHHHDTWWSN